MKQTKEDVEQSAASGQPVKTHPPHFMRSPLKTEDESLQERVTPEAIMGSSRDLNGSGATKVRKDPTRTALNIPVASDTDSKKGRSGGSATTHTRHQARKAQVAPVPVMRNGVEVVTIASDGVPYHHIKAITDFTMGRHGKHYCISDLKATRNIKKTHGILATGASVPLEEKHRDVLERAELMASGKVPFPHEAEKFYDSRPKQQKEACHICNLHVWVTWAGYADRNGTWESFLKLIEDCQEEDTFALLYEVYIEYI